MRQGEKIVSMGTATMSMLFPWAVTWLSFLPVLDRYPAWLKEYMAGKGGDIEAYVLSSKLVDKDPTSEEYKRMVEVHVNDLLEKQLRGAFSHLVRSSAQMLTSGPGMRRS